MLADRWAYTLAFCCSTQNFSCHTRFSPILQAIGQINMNFLHTSNNSFFHGCHCLLNIYVAKVLHDYRIFALKESQNLSFWTLFLGIFSYAQFITIQDFNIITFTAVPFDIVLEKYLYIV